MAERKRFDGRWIRLMGRLGKAVVEHPEIIDVIEGLVGGDGDATKASIEQQPQALELRERGPRRGRPRREDAVYDTADVEHLRAAISTVKGEGGTKAEMIDKILATFGAVNPTTVQNEFAQVGITVALSLIKRQLGLWRKRRQERGE